MSKWGDDPNIGEFSGDYEDNPYSEFWLEEDTATDDPEWALKVIYNLLTNPSRPNPGKIEHIVIKRMIKAYFRTQGQTL